MATEIGKNDIKKGGAALSQVPPDWGAPCLYGFNHTPSLQTRKECHPFRRTQAANGSPPSSAVRITNEQPRTDAAETGARISPLAQTLFRAPLFLKKILLYPAEGNAFQPVSLSALPGTMEDPGGRTFIILPIKAIFHTTAEIVWRRVNAIFSNFTLDFGNEQFI